MGKPPQSQAEKWDMSPLSVMTIWT
jgi:hypothetical protein